MTNFHDLTDKRFGRLKALRYVDGGHWRCACDCGGSAVVLTTNLLKGNSTSCGCKRRETTTTHGMSDTKVYRLWQEMVRRCTRPHHPSYENYGGRGITVCERWLKFENFLADMGARPGGFQIDRIDNDGNYEKSNCRWASIKTNRNNQRNNRVVEFNGRSQTIAQWADECGLNYRTLNNRINRGWSAERALTEGAKIRRRPKQRRKH